MNPNKNDLVDKSRVSEKSTALVLPFECIRASDVPFVGGKGANLGELTASGFPVPGGFCVTATAFECFTRSLANTNELYAQLDLLQSDDLDQVRQVAEQVRDILHGTAIPDAVLQAITQAWRTSGRDYAYAVRSSATAEDLPDASFAGQQDTYLNIHGEASLLESVRKCWASLYTDRAILYRLQQGFDQRNIRIAVVVQRMVEPHVSGILFTAEPVTGNRSLISINASFGLGEALVSGIVSPDVYQVDKQQQAITGRQITDKQVLIRALPQGGVEQVAVEGEMRQQPALTDAQVLALAALGGRIEQHYGTPQDIEWAHNDEGFFILQARPITTLYPLPQPAPMDDALHVYFSFNHFQMMTDPMPALAISIWRMLIAAGRPAGMLENPYITSAGGRIYIDLAPLLRHRLLGRVLPRIFANADAVAALAMADVAKRDSFQQRGHGVRSIALVRFFVPTIGNALARLVRQPPKSTATLGLALMDQYFAQADTKLMTVPTPATRLSVASELLSGLIPHVFRVWFPYFIAGQLGEALLQRVMRGVAAPEDLINLTRGLQGNVVNDMNFAINDLSDLIRTSPDLVHHLGQTGVPAHTRLATTAALPSGIAFLAAWQNFIERYGMRAPAEIDVSRPRWHEDPSSLLQFVVSNVQQGQPGAQRTQHQQLCAEGEAAAKRIIQAARRGAWGWLRGPIVKRLVRAARQFLPTREHHKFWMVRLLGRIKPICLEAGAQLATHQQIEHADDVWFLSMPELLAALNDPNEMLHERIAERRAALTRFRRLTPPHLITSEGEIPVSEITNARAPPGALIGTAVSMGVVEGIAHVIRDPQMESLLPGEILVAPFTDPGWTPLFIAAVGLVTEVGGVMTLGSVVAREYGIPAGVGVVDATRRIRTGQRIRVHGTAGYVEILE